MRRMVRDAWRHLATSGDGPTAAKEHPGSLSSSLLITWIAWPARVMTRALHIGFAFVSGGFLVSSFHQTRAVLACLLNFLKIQSVCFQRRPFSILYSVYLCLTWRSCCSKFSQSLPFRKGVSSIWVPSYWSRLPISTKRPKSRSLGDPTGNQQETNRYQKMKRSEEM